MLLNPDPQIMATRGLCRLVGRPDLIASIDVAKEVVIVGVDCHFTGLGGLPCLFLYVAWCDK